MLQHLWFTTGKSREKPCYNKGLTKFMANPKLSKILIKLECFSNYLYFNLTSHQNVCQTTT